MNLLEGYVYKDTRKDKEVVYKWVSISDTDPYKVFAIVHEIGEPDMQS